MVLLFFSLVPSACPLCLENLVTIQARGQNFHSDRMVHSFCGFLISTKILLKFHLFHQFVTLSSDTLTQQGSGCLPQELCMGLEMASIKKQQTHKISPSATKYFRDKFLSGVSACLSLPQAP